MGLLTLQPGKQSLLIEGLTRDPARELKDILFAGRLPLIWKGDTVLFELEEKQDEFSERVNHLVDENNLNMKAVY